MTGLSLVHVPYKGGGAAIADLLAGQVPIAFLGTGPIMQHVKEGKLRVLAVTTATRFKALPDVPTLNEQGLKGFDMSQWIGIVSAKGTPPKIVKTINKSVNEILKEPDVQDRLLSFGMEALPMTPEQLGMQIRTSLAEYRQLAKTQKISD
jgi:tripartite-type tricarboxylate transporter receptor subunit TctC